MTKNFFSASIIAGTAMFALPALGATSLPGGATSLSETHGDWTVRCGTVDQVVSCEAFQEQISSQNQQRVLAISFDSADAVLTGVLVLPFGLLLANGAVLQIDDKPASEVQSFQTCLPAGCLVPLQIEADWIGALRTGTTLGVGAQSVSGQEATFSISLTGLSSALDRIADLVE